MPRAPAEIKQNRVITNTAEDVTSAFEAGANKALALCNKHNIRFALLKGHSGVKVKGMGLTAKLLVKHQVKVFSEEQIPALIKALAL